MQPYSRWRVISILALCLLVSGFLAKPQDQTAVAQEGTPTGHDTPPVVVSGDPVLTDNAQLTLAISEGSTRSEIRIHVHVVNTSATPMDLEALTPTIEVYDRASQVWPVEQQEWEYETNPLPQNGGARLHLTAINTNILDYNGPVFVRVRDLPDPVITTFAVMFLNGDLKVPEVVLTNPLSDTQVPIGAKQTDTVVTASSASTTSAPRDLNIDAMIPELGELPTGLWIVNEGKLSQSAIASTFTDPAMADRFLNEWGWQENAFVYLEGAPTVDGITYVDVGIHRFATESTALLAMDYYVHGRAEVMGMWEVDDFELGAHGQTITNGTDTTSYAVIDNVVVRVSVAGSNPLPFTAQIRQTVLNKANAQSSISEALILTGHRSGLFDFTFSSHRAGQFIRF